MGQKVNPIGFRLGVNRDWRSRWYASPQELPEFLHSDLEIRNYVKKKLQYAAVSKIVIERAWNSIRVTIFTARPGIVIGRKGAEIEKMTEEISKMAQGKQVKIDIQEIKSPELDAQLVAKIGVKCWMCKKEEPAAQPAPPPPPPPAPAPEQAAV